MADWWTGGKPVWDKIREEEARAIQEATNLFQQGYEKSYGELMQRKQQMSERDVQLSQDRDKFDAELKSQLQSTTGSLLPYHTAGLDAMDRFLDVMDIARPNVRTVLLSDIVSNRAPVEMLKSIIPGINVDLVRPALEGDNRSLARLQEAIKTQFPNIDSTQKKSFDLFKESGQYKALMDRTDMIKQEVERAASKAGMLGSGNYMNELNKRILQETGQQYGAWQQGQVQALQPMIGLGANASQQLDVAGRANAELRANARANYEGLRMGLLGMQNNLANDLSSLYGNRAKALGDFQLATAASREKWQLSKNVHSFAPSAAWGGNIMNQANSPSGQWQGYVSQNPTAVAPSNAASQGNSVYSPAFQANLQGTMLQPTGYGYTPGPNGSVGSFGYSY